MHTYSNEHHSQPNPSLLWGRQANWPALYLAQAWSGWNTIWSEGIFVLSNVSATSMGLLGTA